MQRYLVYGFLDTPIEVLGIPLDRALALIIPVGFGTAVGSMGLGLVIGIISFILYSQVARLKGFNIQANLLALGVPVKGCLPPPKVTSDYCW